MCTLLELLLGAKLTDGPSVRPFWVLYYIYTKEAMPRSAQLRVCVCVLADPILFFFCIQGLLLLFRRKQQKASAGEEGEAKNKFVPSFTHPRQKEEEEEKENGLSEFIKIESS